MENKSTIVSILSSRWIKALIALAVISLLFFFNRVDITVLAGLSQTWPWLLGAFGLMFPPFLIVSYRFKIILLGQGIDVCLRQAIRWTMIGSFFDLAMPSSNGGDLIKAGLVVKHVGAGLRTRAVMAVAFDRVIGLLGLFLLVSLVGLTGWNLLNKMPARTFVLGLSISASIGVLLFFRVLGCRRLYHNQKLDRVLFKHRWGLQIKQFIASFNCIREQPLFLITALCLSIVNHVFWCASLLCVTKAMGYAINPMQGFVVFPLAIFSNIFGIAGGFGLGTVGFDFLLSQLLGIENGALIGLLFQSLNALSRLAGLPFYLIAPTIDKLNTAFDLNFADKNNSDLCETPVTIK
jgi:uncharacterized membrane protein YbhN (UPF0104 family)